MLLNKRLLKLAFFVCLVVHSNFILANPPGSKNVNGSLRLWYDKPATDWNEALPVGNGRLGAMIFGRVESELIQLNEQTLWTGGPADLNPNPDAFKYLQPVRDALLKDSIAKAVGLLKHIQGPDTEMYQPLGDIIIQQNIPEPVSNYFRDLDIGNAIASTGFTANGIKFTREIFSSAPDQVIIIRLTASKPHALQFAVQVFQELQSEKMISSNGELLLKGKARITNDERRKPKPFIYEDDQHCDGMRYQYSIKAITKDGKIDHTDTSLLISNATEVLLLVSAATSFNGYDKCPDKDGKDEAAIASGFLQKAAKKNYDQLLAAHIKDYQYFFNRLSLSLSNDEPPQLPVDRRLAAYKSGNADPHLEELYFQFGRYLLISSSRPGGIPANLQGIWNNLIRPPWRSNYTTNINLQMNYWLASPTNLSELELPLMDHIKRLQKNGTATAKNYYHMRGWALHHNSDIWAQTNPVGEGSGDPKWANWSLGSPWLSQHLFEHYQFTADTAYLRNFAWPIMKSAAEFCMDWLVEKDGVLVTVPSTSPENVYLHPGGFKGTITIASAMDMEIIWDLFTNIIESASVLNIDKDFAKLIASKRSRLSPLKVGRKGNLEEWYGDWEDEDPQHRHVSHLFALHPGREISPLLDTTLANAARKTLELRGDGGTGWSKAWKINFWARLLDGDHAYLMYKELLKTSTLNNLFDTHPPFQIDGNFGATAAVAEMLLQSHLGYLQFLPALPAAWKNGNIQGLVARGNFEVDMFWTSGQLEKASIISKAGGTCKIHSSEKIIVRNAPATQQIIKGNNRTVYVTSFKTVKGNKYELLVKK